MHVVNRGLFAIAATAIVALVQPAAEVSAESKCSRSGTATSVATKDVRVFSRGRPDYQRVYACFQRTGRTTALGTFQSDLGISNETAAGRFVAYQYLLCRGDCARSDVRVIDVKTGRVRRSSKAGPGSAPMFGLVVNRRGSAAWARQYDDARFEVRALTAKGEMTLDSSRGIDPLSLAFAGSRLYWLRDGQASSAVLP